MLLDGITYVKHFWGLNLNVISSTCFVLKYMYICLSEIKYETK